MKKEKAGEWIAWRFKKRLEGERREELSKKIQKIKRK